MMGSTSLQFSGNISNALSVLSEFDTLEEVDLSNNTLVGSIPAQQPSSLSALDVLNLGNNALTGTIPAQLSSLSGLTTLDLSSNTLKGPIPWALVRWAIARRLQLDVRGNKLTLPNDITEEEGRLLVTSVSVSGWAGLTGTIPVQLSSLAALDILDLGNNALTGTIPAQLSSLSGLTTLDLSHNVLRGPIPSSLASLTLRSRCCG
jgi:Leucine-rich repeat (LRR) protein